MTPIALITYNRPDHLRRTIDALSKNVGASKTDMFIFSDGPRSDNDQPLVSEVRHIIESTKGFRTVSRINNIVNVGLSESVINAVTYVLSMYNSVIVVEDDLVTSPNFLAYMNHCLDLFRDRKDISSISGYNAIPATKPYLSHRPCSWGWATWNDRWFAFDPYDQKITRKDKRGFNRGGDDLYRMYRQYEHGVIDSWAVRWAFHNYKNSLYSFYPATSKVLNIGNDGSGTHVKKTNRYNVQLDSGGGFVYNKDVQPDPVMLNRFRAFYRYSLYKRIKLLIYDLCVRTILR